MTNFISTKELYTNLKKVSERVMKGDSYIVLKFSKPAFTISPFQSAEQSAAQEKKYSWKDGKKFMFTGKDKKEKNLAQNFKKYIYS